MILIFDNIEIVQKDICITYKIINLNNSLSTFDEYINENI